MNAGEPERGDRDSDGRTPEGAASLDATSRMEVREFRERVRNEPGRTQRFRPDLARLVRILLGREEEEGSDGS